LERGWKLRRVEGRITLIRNSDSLVGNFVLLVGHTGIKGKEKEIKRTCREKRSY
jgi:hypothetical protein